MSEITKVLNLPDGAIVSFRNYMVEIPLYIEKYFHKFKIICARQTEYGNSDFYNVNVYDIEDCPIGHSMFEAGVDYERYSSTYTRDAFIFILCSEMDYLKIKLLYDDYDTGLTPYDLGITE